MADFCGAIGKKESRDFLAIGGQVLCCQDYEKYLDGFRKVKCVIIAYWFIESGYDWVCTLKKICIITTQV